MSAETDFLATIERAAGLTVDATCAARAAGYGRLPALHRRQLNASIRALERATDIFFELNRTPWLPSNRPKQRQLELL